MIVSKVEFLAKLYEMGKIEYLLFMAGLLAPVEHLRACTVLNELETRVRCSPLESWEIEDI